ncbi:PilZ domain-containing protein [Novosphingobium sp. 1949]|uniref:PilZ domain-containing protein n=1 Tax=Novosphingobium organovorum TaxID=2930092 RepID=A0ABT0B8B1_9SPHN|nr:PilZ domain-containing protein [Novosphingobium organovorum]MCJ2181317.1 PilZ domain-containing protein [Novosphingobium organovorum]
MSQRLARLPSIHTLKPAERRREGRHPSRHGVVVRCDAALRGSAWLIDISPYGCALWGRGLALRCGVVVTLRPIEAPHSAETDLDAIVRWIREDTAGLEFLRPLTGSAKRPAAVWQAIVSESPP